MPCGGVAVSEVGYHLLGWKEGSMDARVCEGFCSESRDEVCGTRERRWWGRPFSFGQALLLPR